MVRKIEIIYKHYIHSTHIYWVPMTTMIRILYQIKYFHLCVKGKEINSIINYIKRCKWKSYTKQPHTKLSKGLSGERSRGHDSGTVDIFSSEIIYAHRRRVPSAQTHNHHFFETMLVVQNAVFVYWGGSLLHYTMTI